MLRQVLALEDLSTIYGPAASVGSVENFSLGGFIAPLIQNILIVSGLLALFTIIFAGFSYISAGGDKNKISQSTNMLTYAVLGMVVVGAAFLITRVVGTLGGVKLLP